MDVFKLQEETDCDKDDVEEEHNVSHGAVHAPLEHYDCDDDDYKYCKEQYNRAEHAAAVHYVHLVEDDRVHEPRQWQPGTARET